MVSLDDAIIARWEKGGERLEILVDPETAHQLKEGDDVPGLLDQLAAEEIFKDARKGDRASEEVVEKAYGLMDEAYGRMDPPEQAEHTLENLARWIIKEGNFQLTTDQRRKLLETKRKAIVAEIARNAINPKSKAPHPPNRIEAAMEEAKIRVDEHASVEAQVKRVIKALGPIIPISMEKMKMAIKIPGDRMGALYGDITSFADIRKEEWQKDGTWVCIVEFPAGLMGEFMDRLASRSPDVDTKILN